MTLAFKPTDAEIPRGRRKADIPDYVPKAVADALKSGKNVETTAPHEHIKTAQRAFIRYRREHADLAISVSLTQKNATESTLVVEVRKAEQ
jgi:hypothetical protein